MLVNQTINLLIYHLYFLDFFPYVINVLIQYNLCHFQTFNLWKIDYLEKIVLSVAYF